MNLDHGSSIFHARVTKCCDGVVWYVFQVGQMSPDSPASAGTEPNETDTGGSHWRGEYFQTGISNNSLGWKLNRSWVFLERNKKKHICNKFQFVIDALSWIRRSFCNWIIVFMCYAFYGEACGEIAGSRKADKSLRRSASPFQAFSVRSSFVKDPVCWLFLSFMVLQSLVRKHLFFIFEPPTMGMLRKHYNF